MPPMNLPGVANQLKLLNSTVDSTGLAKQAYLV